MTEQRDLISLLREAEEHGGWDGMEREAADEIERLREQEDVMQLSINQSQARAEQAEARLAAVRAYVSVRQAKSRFIHPPDLLALLDAPREGGE